MDRSRCSVAGTLAVVGEKWSLLVLREAFFGRAPVRRTSSELLGAPKAVLTDRLAHAGGPRGSSSACRTSRRGSGSATSTGSPRGGSPLRRWWPMG